MTKPRVLILGGTRQARLLAERVEASGLAAPVTSLAGATETPAAVSGSVRVGGFGGVSGMTDHLRREGYVAVIDATHPFAVRISANASAACDAAAVPRLELQRRPWQPMPGDRWRDVPDEAAAAEAVSALDLPPGETVFLALGRQRVAAFATIAGPRFLLRTTDPIEPPFPGCEVIVGRGPFPVEEEETLFHAEAVRVLVCRNSGGDGEAKLRAARAVNAEIVVIGRPAGQAPTGPVAHGVEEAVTWLTGLIAELP